MNLMIKLKNHENESERVTMDELCAQAFVFFVAGFETSSAAMTFCLYELAINQEIQDKLRFEIKKTIEKCNDEIEYENILQQIVLIRIAENDYNIGETSHIIPKGMVVLIPA